MRRYCLTQQAEADLSEIWDYSDARWGRDQADRYVSALFDCFARALDAPEAGRNRSAFVPGARSTQSGRHLAFYRETEHGVVILRIVHEARNWAALRFADEAR